MFIKREKNDVVKLYEDINKLLTFRCNKVVFTKSYTIINHVTDCFNYGVIVINAGLRPTYNISYITYYCDEIRIRFNIIKYYNNDKVAIPENINDIKYEDLRKIIHDNLNDTVYSDDYQNNFEFFIDVLDYESVYIWDNVDRMLFYRKFADIIIKYYNKEFYDYYLETTDDIIKPFVKYVRKVFSKHHINTTVCAVFTCCDEYEDVFTKISYMEGSTSIITVHEACNDVLPDESNINRYTDLVLIGLVASK